MSTSTITIPPAEVTPEQHAWAAAVVADRAKRGLAPYAIRHVRVEHRSPVAVSA